MTYITSFSITKVTFDIADPSNVQDDACHNELSKYDVDCYESCTSLVVRAADQSVEGHGLNSCRGLKFFSLSHAHDKLNITSFLLLY